jgi:hypothetical protein
MIFGKDIEKRCVLCAHAVSITGSESLLCRKKGVVTALYKCISFRYDPLKKVPAANPVLNSFSPSDFKL